MLAVIVGFFVLITYFQARPVKRFCEQVPKLASRGQMIESAEASGFFVLAGANARGQLSVLNHRVFFFRYACHISFVHGAVSGTKFMAAD